MVSPPIGLELNTVKRPRLDYTIQRRKKKLQYIYEYIKAQSNPIQIILAARLRVFRTQNRIVPAPTSCLTCLFVFILPTFFYPIKFKNGGKLKINNVQKFEAKK